MKMGEIDIQDYARQLLDVLFRRSTFDLGICSRTTARPRQAPASLGSAYQRRN